MMYKPSQYNIVADTDNIGRQLVFNAVSGAVAWMDKNDKTVLSSAKPMDEELFDKALIDKGFMVHSDFDEWGSLIFSRQQLIFNPSPSVLGFVIAPTMACNLSCPYCFEQDGRELKTMSDDILHSTVLFVKRHIEQHPLVKNIYVSWFGGEPCLQLSKIREFSKEIIHFTASKGISYESRIVTNAVLLDGETARILREECRVYAAQITIDGLRDDYATRKGCKPEVFEKVVNNIEAACDLLKISLRINIDSQNIDKIPELLTYLLDDRGLNGKIGVYFALLQKWNNEEGRSYLSGGNYVKFLRNIYQQAIVAGWSSSFLQKRPIREIGPCGAMRNTSCMIGPDGNLYRCEHSICKPEWKTGNINFGYYRNSADMKYLLAMPQDSCRNCQAFPICSGGCLANRMLHDNAADCEYYVDMIKESIRFAVKTKRKGGV